MSPLKLQCERLFSRREARDWKVPRLENIKLCHWTCRGPLKAARFVSRKRSGEYAVVHPSTKTRGMWQVSLFDAEGPYGDMQRSTCNAAVKEMPRTQWKLVEWA